jgi:O-methyltransferase
MTYYLKKIIQKILNKLGIAIVPIKDKSDCMSEENFAKIREVCKKYSDTRSEAMYALYQATKYVVEAGIPGDFVECGVWRGGSVMVMAMTLVQMGVADKKIYLYDTFEGMTEPTTEDKIRANDTEAKILWEKENGVNHNNWCYASLEDVQENVYSTGYPKENFIFVRGKVEETIPQNVPQEICLLRLDTDWYESTKHELEHLYPLLANKGVMIMDDYGYWAGHRKAIDEYFQKHNLHVLLNRVDESVRLVIKG